MPIESFGDNGNKNDPPTIDENDEVPRLKLALLLAPARRRDRRAGGAPDWESNTPRPAKSRDEQL